ncbi:MAG TPA: molybdate ABC transporter substrate-binding protein [Candidatus Acidoferrum sp.]|nr:molybdate ABC transporter substrate-binding protein [Candidatus Acidoferrum sp.]
MPNRISTPLCKGRLLRRAFLLFSFFLSSAVGAQTLRIAAASDLQFALPDLAAQYEKQTGVKLVITYGSSGNFFGQIRNGAPFDLFLSADTEYPRKLMDEGLAVPDSLRPYAIGHLVLWYPKDSPLSFSDGVLKTLLDPRVQKIAIANPEHAPYGRVAVAVLRGAGLYERVKSKLVFGENVSQAAQFVQSGNAQAGLIAFSLALSPAMAGGQCVGVATPHQDEQLMQAAVVLGSSGNKLAAASFLSFLKTPAARKILTQYGFSSPDEFPYGATKP